MPNGSAPLIIEDEEVYLKEGEIIFFLGSTYHSVPCNNTDGRCALVGNVMYIDKCYINC